MSLADVTIAECPSPETLTIVKHLLNELASSDPLRQTNAQKQLNAMGLLAVRTIGEMLRAEREKARRRDNDPKRIVPCILGCCGFAALLGYLPHSVQAVVGLLPLVLLIGFCFWYGVFAKSRVHLERTAEFVLSLQDKCCVPALVELFEKVSNFNQKRAVMDALIKLLPKIEEADAPLFSDHQRALLNKYLLGIGYDFCFRVAVLKSLSKIGNASSLPIIKRLAHSRFEWAMRAPAGECLDRLERRLAAPGQTLLRPSSANVQNETLLRAASKSAAWENQEANLLRATSREARKEA